MVAPRSRARSASSRISTAAPSPITKPSRSASNGREMPFSESASSAAKAAVASGVSMAPEPVPHRHRAGGGVAHHQRHGQRRDGSRSLLEQRLLPLLERADAADAGADHTPDPARLVGELLVPAGLAQRLVGGHEGELGEAVRAAD